MEDVNLELLQGWEMAMLHSWGAWEGMQQTGLCLHGTKSIHRHIYDLLWLWMAMVIFWSEVFLRMKLWLCLLHVKKRFQKIKVINRLLLNECSSFKAAWLEFNLSLALPSLCTGSFRTVRFVWLLQWLWAHRHAADFHPMKCQLWGFIPVKSGSKIEMVKWVIAHWENREWISQTRPTSAGFACTSKDAASRFHQPIVSSKDHQRSGFRVKRAVALHVCIAYIMNGSYGFGAELTFRELQIDWSLFRRFMSRWYPQISNIWATCSLSSLPWGTWLEDKRKLYEFVPDLMPYTYVIQNRRDSGRER